VEGQTAGRASLPQLGIAGRQGEGPRGAASRCLGPPSPPSSPLSPTPRGRPRPLAGARWLQGAGVGASGAAHTLRAGTGRPAPRGACPRPGRAAEPRGGEPGEGVCSGGRGAASPLPPSLSLPRRGAAAATAATVSARAGPGRAGRAAQRGAGGRAGGRAGRGGGWARGGRAWGRVSRSRRPAPAGRPWRRPRRLTLGASCRAPGRHVRGWRGRAGRLRGRGRARGAAAPTRRAAARTPAGLPVCRRRRRGGLGRLRAGHGCGCGGHGRRTGRRWLGPDRREEGSAALRSAGQETGETRSVLRLQGRRALADLSLLGGQGPAGDPGPLPLQPPPLPPASLLGPLHRGSAAVARAQLASSRIRVLLGWKKGGGGGITKAQGPSFSLCKESKLARYPGALLLCRSSPEALSPERSCAGRAELLRRGKHLLGASERSFL
jgi:hypothetical protein